VSFIALLSEGREGLGVGKEWVLMGRENYRKTGNGTLR